MEEEPAFGYKNNNKSTYHSHGILFEIPCDSPWVKKINFQVQIAAFFVEISIICENSNCKKNFVPTFQKN